MLRVGNKNNKNGHKKEEKKQKKKKKKKKRRRRKKKKRFDIKQVKPIGFEAPRGGAYNNRKHLKLETSCS